MLNSRAKLRGITGFDDDALGSTFEVRFRAFDSSSDNARESGDNASLESGVIDISSQNLKRDGSS